MTIQNDLIAALVARGWVRDSKRHSTKYVVMTTTNLQGDSVYFYVGKAGALRKGATISKSVPADREKAILLRPAKPVVLVHASTEGEAA